MFWPRRVSRHCRTLIGPNRKFLLASRCFQHKATSPDSKIDFLEIERKWQARWDARGTKIQEERDERDHPLMPFYMDHIRSPTIMGTLQSMLARKGTMSAPNGNMSMVERILFHGDTSLSLSISRQETLDTYSQRYGWDVVRTSIILNQGADTNVDPHITEKLMVNTQKWFERVWEAVRVAHIISFDDTDAGSSGPPDFETRNTNPDFIDELIDYDLNSLESLVVMPPTLPGTFDMKTEEEACALWLASQEAILSMTCKSKTVDSHQVQTCLRNLVNLIIHCEEEDGPYWIDLGVHYHSTRILLSLIALFAPSFAEASWVALHYGHDQRRDKETGEEEGTIPRTGSECGEQLVREDLTEVGLQNLPRRDDHRTLSSIFAQPFPTPESPEVIGLLKQRSSQSILGGCAGKTARNDIW